MTVYRLNCIPRYEYAQTVVHLNQGEKGSKIGFVVHDGDTYIPFGAYDGAGTIMLNILKADKTIFSDIVADVDSTDPDIYNTTEMEEGYFEVTLKEQMTLAAGECIAEFVFLVGGVKKASANFIIDVERSPLDMDGAESESVVAYIDASIQRAETAATSASTSASNAAASASTASRYASYITAAQKISNIDDITVIPNFTGAGGTVSMAQTTSEYVLVEHDDNVIGAGGFCLYKQYDGYGYISEADLNFGWKRNNGSFVFPVPDQGQLTANDVPLDDIFSVMETYIGNSALEYTNDGYGTLYSETCSGKIDCSSFVCAILQGIRYSHSRYHLGNWYENIPGGYIGPHYFPTLPSQSGRTHSLKVCKLAEWFAAHKQLFTIPSERSVDILRPGDIIFSKIDGMSANASKALFGIGHAAIVVQTYPRDGLALVAQSGGFTADLTTYPTHTYNIDSMQELSDTGCKLTIIDIQKLVDIGYLKVFARPAYGAGKRQGTNITGNFVSSGLTISAASSVLQEIGWIVPSEALKPSTFYSIELLGTHIPSWLSNGCYVVIQCCYKDNGSDVYDSGQNRTTHLSVDRGVLKFSFVTEASIGSGAVIRLSVLAPNFSGSPLPGSPITIDISAVALIEGAPCDTHRMQRLGVTAGSNVSVANRSYRMGGKCFLDIVADITNASTGTITIGTISRGFPGTRSNIQMVGFNGSKVVPVAVSTTGVITATVASKDGNILKILGDLPVRAMT